MPEAERPGDAKETAPADPGEFQEFRNLNRRRCVFQVLFNQAVDLWFRRPCGMKELGVVKRDRMDVALCHRDGLVANVADGSAADRFKFCSVLCGLRYFFFLHRHANPPP